MRAACPVDIAAFYLNDGTECGRHAATQTLLSGIACGLDDRGLQLDPSKYEYIPNNPLPADSQPPEAPPGWLVRNDRSFGLVWVPPSGSQTVTFATSTRSWTGVTSFMARLSRLQSPATAVVLLGFCLGWCPITFMSGGSFASVSSSGSIECRPAHVYCLSSMLQVAVTPRNVASRSSVHQER